MSLTFIHMDLFKDTADTPSEFMCIEDLRKFGKEGVYLGFSIANAEELKKSLGYVDYDVVYNEIRKFMHNFEDGDTMVGEYGGDRFLFIMRNKNPSFVRDFAEGVMISINDEIKSTDETICLNFGIHIKAQDKDFFKALRATDKCL